VETLLEVVIIWVNVTWANLLWKQYNHSSQQCNLTHHSPPEPYLSQYYESVFKQRNCLLSLDILKMYFHFTAL